MTAAPSLFTAHSSSIIGSNTAPDSILAEAAFLDGSGAAVPVDLDLRADIYKAGGTTIVESRTLTGDPKIEVASIQGGTFYYTKVDPALLAGMPLEVHWLANIKGKKYTPFPLVTYHGAPATESENILLSVAVKLWIKKQLGWPMIPLEIPDEAVDQSIGDALRDFNSARPKINFGLILLAAGQTRYEVSFGRGLIRVEFVRTEGTPLISDPLFGREYPRGQQLDFDQYVLGRAFFETLLRVTSQEPEYRWEPSDPTHLYIAAQEQSYDVYYEYASDHRLEEISPAQHQDFMHGCLMYAKRRLVTVRGRYGSSIPGPKGDQDTDVDAMREEVNTFFEKPDGAWWSWLRGIRHPTPVVIGG